MGSKKKEKEKEERAGLHVALSRDQEIINNTYCRDGIEALQEAYYYSTR